MIDGKIVHDKDGRWIQGEPRSYDRCLANWEKWVAGGENLGELKEYQGSNKYPPLQIFDKSKNSTPYLELFVPPMLHLILGKIHVPKSNLAE